MSPAKRPEGPFSSRERMLYDLQHPDQDEAILQLQKLIELTLNPLVSTVDAPQVASLALKVMRHLRHLSDLAYRNREWISDTDLPSDIREILESLAWEVIDRVSDQP